LPEARKWNKVEAMPASISPHLCVSNAAAAIDFYKKAFGARELARHPAPDGKRLMHAALELNGGTVMLADDFPEYHGGKGNTGEAYGGSPILLHLQTDDADALWKQALAAGATIVMPLADQFWGDRYGQVKDPFGFIWSIGAPVKQTQQQSAERPATA